MTTLIDSEADNVANSSDIYRNIRNSGESANVNSKTDNVEQSSSGNILEDKLDESGYPEVVDNCTAQILVKRIA